MSSIRETVGRFLNGERDGGRSSLRVTTDRADYRIHPGTHYTASRPGAEMDDIDGLVVEGGHNSPESLDMDALLSMEQFGDLLADEGDVTVYNVDVPGIGASSESYRVKWATHKLNIGEQVGRIGVPFYAAMEGVAQGHPEAAVLSLPMAGMAASLAGGSDRGNDLASRLQTSYFYTSAGLRSALAAEKMEEFVAPQLEERTGERPEILVDYGAGHLDIGQYLDHPRLREWTIRLHGMVRNVPLDNDYTDTVAEYRFDDFDEGLDTCYSEALDTDYQWIIHHLDR